VVLSNYSIKVWRTKKNLKQQSKKKNIKIKKVVAIYDLVSVNSDNEIKSETKNELRNT